MTAFFLFLGPLLVILLPFGPCISNFLVHFGIKCNEVIELHVNVIQGYIQSEVTCDLPQATQGLGGEKFSSSTGPCDNIQLQQEVVPESRPLPRSPQE